MTANMKAFMRFLYSRKFKLNAMIKAKPVSARNKSSVKPILTEAKKILSASKRSSLFPSWTQSKETKGAADRLD